MADFRGVAASAFRQYCNGSVPVPASVWRVVEMECQKSGIMREGTYWPSHKAQKPEFVYHGVLKVPKKRPRQSLLRPFLIFCKDGGAGIFRYGSGDIIFWLFLIYDLIFQLFSVIFRVRTRLQRLHRTLKILLWISGSGVCQIDLF